MKTRKSCRVEFGAKTRRAPSEGAALGGICVLVLSGLLHKSCKEFDTDRSHLKIERLFAAALLAGVVFVALSGALRVQADAAPLASAQSGKMAGSAQVHQ